LQEMQSIRRTVLLLVISAVLLAVANEQVGGGVVAAYTHSGGYRALTVRGDPNLVYPNVISGAAVAFNPKLSNTSISAELDTLGISFGRNPGDSPFTYVGYFTASGQWTFGTGGGINASLVEVQAAFWKVLVWYDKDGVAGLQYQPGRDPTDCSKSWDCFDSTLSKDLKDLSWGTISTTTEACPAGYSTNCSVYTFTLSTTGADAGFVTLAWKYATQPVLKNGVVLKPDYAKIDITINYPWPTTVDASTNPKIGLVVGTAGKTGSVSGAVSVADGKAGAVWERNGKNIYFNWDGTAQVGAATSTVHIDSTTLEELKAASCSIIPLTTNYDPICVGLALLGEGYKVFGWNTRVILFSWTDVKPTSIYWDPAAGSSTTALSNDSPFALGSIMMVFVSLVLSILMF